MAQKTYNPYTPSRRFMTKIDFSGLTKKKPHKALLAPLKKTGGRNNRGRITCRHRGGGHKRRYRIIDFRRDKLDVPAVVEAIEYDPNRSARIALLKYMDGEWRYILCPKALSVGDRVVSADKADPQPGVSMPLRNIPTGQLIHNIELYPGRGGQLVRSAGVSAQLMAKLDRYAHVLLPSGEVRMILLDCRATIGQLGNFEHNTVKIGKAGRNRWLGKRPTVRGTAMNPVSHPMGGGEGRRGGGRHPCSPWGKPAKGGKTRNKKKSSKKMIVSGRKRGRFQK